MARIRTQERQKQIVDEAINIIHEKGYSGLSIRELSKKVGITEPGIYRHFENKEQIIMGILDRMTSLGQDLQQNLQKISDTREKVHTVLRLQAKYLEENPTMTSVIFSEEIFERNTSVRNKIMQIMTQRFQLLCHLMEEGQKTGVVVEADVEDLSTFIIGNFRLLVKEWRNADFKFSLMGRVNRVIESIDKIMFVGQGK